MYTFIIDPDHRGGGLPLIANCSIGDKTKEKMRGKKYFLFTRKMANEHDT